ncbi:unnamed protein product [Musa hybrid cultivar]
MNPFFSCFPTVLPRSSLLCTPCRRSFSFRAASSLPRPASTYPGCMHDGQTYEDGHEDDEANAFEVKRPTELEPEPPERRSISDREAPWCSMLPAITSLAASPHSSVRRIWSPCSSLSADMASSLPAVVTTKWSVT